MIKGIFQTLKGTIDFLNYQDTSYTMANKNYEDFCHNLFTLCYIIIKNFIEIIKQYFNQFELKKIKCIIIYLRII